MLTLSSARACAFVCGGCGLSSALHAGPPASHHALTTIAASHRVVLMLASLGECGTADAHSTPGRRGLTMPRIADRLDPGGERAPLLPRPPPPLVGEGVPLAFGSHCLCVSSRCRNG